MALLVVVAGALAVPFVSVDPRIEALLPEDLVRSEALAEARRRYAADGSLLFIVQSPDPALNRRVARQISPLVREWDDVVWAIDRRDPTYFSRRRLLYLDASVIVETADEVETRIEWERCARNPFCVNLEERSDPDLDRLHRALEALPMVRTLRSLFGVEGLEVEGEGVSDDESRVGELCRPDGRVCVVQAVLGGDASDVSYVADVVRRARFVMDRVRAPHSEQLQLRLGGRLGQLAESRSAVDTDLARTLALSTMLVLCVLLAQFRGARAFVFLVMPMLVGLAATTLSIAALDVQLNAISAAVLVVFSGIGIDFGIHLLTRYGELRAELAVSDAARATIASLSRPLALATATTGAGFLALSTGQFEGFAQMGGLCVVAILYTAVAFVGLFGALVELANRHLPERRSLTREVGVALFRSPARASRRFVGAVMITAGVVTAAGAFAVMQVEFEYDMGRLMRVADPSRVDYGPALGGTARSPTLMLADDPGALEAAAAGIRALHPDGFLEGEEWLFTPKMFIPDDQEARLAAIARLQRALVQLRPHASPATLQNIERHAAYVDVSEPITTSSLPTWVQQLFSERDGRIGTVGILHEGGASQDARRMEVRARRLRDWHARYPNVHFASQAALLGDVTATLRDDAPRVVGLAVLGLLLAALVVSRSLSLTMVIFAPVCLAVAACAVAMFAFDMRINLYNVIVFPLAFGVGVDGAVYMTLRVLGETRAADWSALPGTGRAVLGSTLTTMVAFGSLAVSSNPGLSSLGTLAIVALSATLIANLGFLPFLLVRVARLTPRGLEPNATPPPRP